MIDEIENTPEPVTRGWERMRKGRTLRRRYFPEADRCEVCGWTPPKRVRGGRLKMLHVHHIRPLSEGGNDNRDNLAIVCMNCHGLAHTIWKRGCRNFPIGRLAFVALMRKEMDDPDLHGYGSPSYLPRPDQIDGEFLISKHWRGA